MVPNIYRNQIGLVLRQNYKNKMFFNFPQVSFKKQNFQKFEINELILRLFIVITDCGKSFKYLYGSFDKISFISWVPAFRRRSGCWGRRHVSQCAPYVHSLQNRTCSCSLPPQMFPKNEKKYKINNLTIKLNIIVPR